MSQEQLKPTCPVCGEHLNSEEERIAHERSAHNVGRTGPSVEDSNTTVSRRPGEKDRAA
ncbi:MAG TPA: hypothetical protein VFI95_20330 [Terriglobales bacterium]|nr:hypothetical protein [Terriglobales bacterium]